MNANVLVMPELDERDRHEQRYAAYAIDAAASQEARWSWARRELMSTPTLDGIGQMLALLRDEGEITDDTRVGILDRVDGRWIVNPWAKGTL